MSRLQLSNTAKNQAAADKLYQDLERHLASAPVGTCPVDLALGCLTLCHAQTCGKCVPCRIGLSQLKDLLTEVLDGYGTEETLDTIESLAETVMFTADCAIGTTAAALVKKSITNFRDDYEEHVKNGHCLASTEGPVPCVALCPANVDIPGYIALVREGKPADAVRLIRKDNPFPLACAYICEHPCEAHCRRGMLDAPINVRGIKRFAIDNCGEMTAPAAAESTGKKVAVIGGGPGGLTAAYYLQLMGHQVTVFEQRDKLGGMMRYGIPDYRLPRTRLDDEISFILSTGIEVKKNFSIGSDMSFADLRKDYDAVFVAIGAHTDKKLGIEGEDADGVMSAVQLLRGIGDGNMPDFRGKKVIVVGGGNVAMDCTRTSVRLGADKVTCVYRRRIEDMTALPEEVAGAQAEGAEVLELHAPVRIETENGKVKYFVAQPQIISNYDKAGRPAPAKADLPEVKLEADIVLVAIGQAIVTAPFEDVIPTNRGSFKAASTGMVKEADGVFAGGDCVTGPATVIRAIAAGKVAAANIDRYLGFDHKISADVEIPLPHAEDKPQCGRINIPEREACERKNDFICIELGLTEQAACQESGRCLRCDHFGFGALRGGRKTEW